MAFLIVGFTSGGNGGLTFAFKSGGSAAIINPGTPGNDTIDGSDSEDTLLGAAGDDSINGDGGDDEIDGGPGNDTLVGGDGDDDFFGGDGNDVFIDDNWTTFARDSATGGAGIDRIESPTSVDLFFIQSDVENLTLTGSGDVDGFGGRGANIILGNVGRNVLHGDDGADTINGGMGDDTIGGEEGKDLLTGSGGLDRFTYFALSDSGVTFATRDAISTFAHGDKIDLSQIDARPGAHGNQAFTFVANFTGQPGQLQFDTVAATSFLITADVNGDAVNDWTINLYTSAGFGTVQPWDFIL
jgi:Ca2+-binding RTX toxin-like protein